MAVEETTNERRERPAEPGSVYVTLSGGGGRRPLRATSSKQRNFGRVRKSCQLARWRAAVHRALWGAMLLGPDSAQCKTWGDHMRHRSVRAAVLVAVLATLSTACGSSAKSTTPTSTGTSGTLGSSTTGSSATKNVASAPGVTATSITIGLITSVTGNASSTFYDSAKGAQARFDALNAAGGLNGRKINMIVADDQSSPTGDLTASQDFVGKGVFAVIDYTPYAFGGYKYLQQQGIPVTGGAFDGPEWGMQPNTNMFAYTGGVDPHYPANTRPGAVLQIARRDQGGRLWPTAYRRRRSPASRT